MNGCASDPPVPVRHFSDRQLHVIVIVIFLEANQHSQAVRVLVDSSTLSPARPDQSICPPTSYTHNEWKIVSDPSVPMGIVLVERIMFHHLPERNSGSSLGTPAKAC